MQRTKLEAESAESSKEADNPSPVSVLEVTIREDDVLSCPGSFEQVSADLRGTYKPLTYFKFLDCGCCRTQISTSSYNLDIFFLKTINKKIKNLRKNVRFLYYHFIHCEREFRSDL